MSKAKKKQS